MTIADCLLVRAKTLSTFDTHAVAVSRIAVSRIAVSRDAPFSAHRIEKFEGQYRSQLKIDRAMMQKARVIGQAFNKWIVVQAGADVVLVDQV